MTKTTSESELGAFFNMSPDLVCIAGRDGFLKKANPVFISKLGYTPEELFTNPIEYFIHPDDVASTMKVREYLLAGNVLQNFVNRYITKKGEVLWLEWTSMLMPGTRKVLAIAKDITSRIQLEKELEEKYRKVEGLAAHFKHTIEKDRRLFAEEMHEELAQLTAAVKMDIDWIASNEQGLSQVSRKRIENASKVSALLIKTLQRISFMVSPGMLNDFGLSITLDSFCKDFTHVYGIPCSFSATYEEQRLTAEMKIDFFRVCQEALADVIDLRKARKIYISITDTVTGIELSITDEGAGFSNVATEQGSRLENIRQRVVSINGKLKLKGGTGGGLKVSVEIKQAATPKMKKAPLL